MTADRTARSTEAQLQSRLDVTCCLGCRALTLCLSMRTLFSAQPFRPIWRNSGGEEGKGSLGEAQRGDCSEVLIDVGIFLALGVEVVVLLITSRSISPSNLPAAEALPSISPLFTNKQQKGIRPCSSPSSPS